MGRIRNTVELAKASWHVLQADKELMILPVLSSIASIVIGATFVLPVVLITGGEGPASAVFGFLGYFALSFVVVFFNTALVSAAYERLAGGDPTVGSALRAATEHLPAILGWSAISATVSAILKAIEERAGFLGGLVASLAGLAWTLVTFLVIPVYVVEGVGVVDAVKRSAGLFKQTWGENVVANVGFGLLGFLAYLPLAAVVILAILSGSTAVIIAAIVLAVIAGIVIAVMLSTLSVIFQTALYLYASNGVVPDAYQGVGLATAFRPKR